MKEPTETPEPAGRFICGRCGHPCTCVFEMWQAPSRDVRNRQMVGECCAVEAMSDGWFRRSSYVNPRPLRAVTKAKAAAVGRSALPAGDRE